MEPGDEAVRLAADLIGIDSINPTLVPGAAGESQIVQFLAHRLASRGFDTQVVHPDGMPDRPSLIASATFGPGPVVVLNGHVDTVGVEGMEDPFTARIEGDRLFGRGACDMKAGVAGMAVAAEMLMAQKPQAGTLICTFVADEEDASVGTPCVIEALAREGMSADLAIIGEPSWLDIAVAHRGFAVMRAELHGRATHTSRREEGLDAVAAMARLIAAVGTHDIALTKRPSHPLVGHGSAVVSVARGGTAPFTIAAQAQAWVERRTLPGESGADALSELQDLLEQVREAYPGITTDASIELERPAWEITPGSAASDFIANLTDAMGALGRPAPKEYGAPYWMESALWEEAGVPSLVFGPAGGSLHAIDEWVDVGQVRMYPLALSAALTEFFTSSTNATRRTARGQEEVS